MPVITMNATDVRVIETPDEKHPHRQTKLQIEVVYNSGGQPVMLDFHVYPGYGGLFRRRRDREPNEVLKYEEEFPEAKDFDAKGAG